MALLNQNNSFLPFLYCTSVLLYAVLTTDTLLYIPAVPPRAVPGQTRQHGALEPEAAAGGAAGLQQQAGGRHEQALQAEESGQVGRRRRLCRC